eukprot:TRINITY_DN10056_c0_g1_i2.p1 TRINITY_DN10056_c0_g1~~TRINITY_DN10056_c0_g1_i2.p1  ORF type:complete len:776 (+),score=141.89 TRINITY_DN10056_c0_g1_i2:224-2551(+)
MSDFVNSVQGERYLESYALLQRASPDTTAKLDFNLLKALCQGLISTGEMHKAKSVLATMKRLNPSAYNKEYRLVESAVYGLAKARRWDAVSALYNDLVDMNVEISLDLHNIGLRSCIQTKQVEAAIAIMDQIKTQDPLQIPTEDLMRLFASDGKWDLCVYSLQEAFEQRLPVNDQLIHDLANLFVDQKSESNVETIPHALMQVLSPAKQSILLSQILRKSVTTENQKHAIAFVRQALEVDVKPSDDLLIALLNAEKSLHGLTRAIAQLDQLITDKNLQPGKKYFITLCESYIAASDPENAVNTVKQMATLGHKPPHVMLEDVVRVCGKKNRLDLGDNLIQTMQSINIQPSLLFFTAFLHGGAKSENLNLCLDVLKVMQKHNVTPDSVALSVLIDACGKSHDCKKALEIFDLMKEMRLPISIVTYNIVIDALGRASQINDCIKIFQEIEVKGLEPTETTYGIMISHLSKQSSLHMCRIYLDHMKQKNLRPNLYVYNSYLHACARMGDFQEGIQILEEMKQNNIRADIITYTNLIRAFASANQQDMGLAIFRNLRVKGLSPNIQLYAAVLKLFEHSGNYTQALETFQDLKQSGVVVDHGIFSSLLYTLGRSKEYDRLWDLLAEAESCGIQLTNYEITNYFRGLMKGNQHDIALAKLRAIHENQRSIKIKPQSFIYDRLVDHFANRRDSASVIEVLELLRTNSNQIDKQTYVLALVNFLKIGRRRDLERLVQQGLRQGISLRDPDYNHIRNASTGIPDAEHYIRLIESYHSPVRHPTQ